MKKYFILFLLIFLISCAPGAFKPDPIEIYNGKITKEYTYDFTKDEIPQKLIPIFLDKNFKVCEQSKAKYLAFTGKEFTKIKQTQKIAKYYKTQLENHIKLINDDIRIINMKDQLIVLENQKSIKYREIWIDSENSYKQEKYYHDMDVWINRVSNVCLGIGIVIIAIIAL